MRQDQYVIKSAYKPVTYSLNLIKSSHTLDLTDNIEITPEGNIVDRTIISLFNPAHVSVLLCNYSKIKENSWDRLNSDIRYVMMDLENTIDTVLKKDYPMYFDILVYKIDGKQNLEIQ